MNLLGAIIDLISLEYEWNLEKINESRALIQYI